MRGTGALVVAAMLDFLTFALCAPYSETTEGKQFDVLLEKVADRGRTLYRLFQQPSHTIVKVKRFIKSSSKGREEGLFFDTRIRRKFSSEQTFLGLRRGGGGGQKL